MKKTHSGMMGFSSDEEDPIASGDDEFGRAGHESEGGWGSVLLDESAEVDDDDDNVAPSHNTTLAKYKDLMVEKIQQHCPEMVKIFPQHDAETKVCNCITKIFQAESEQDVDDQVKLFLNEFFPGQFNQTWNV